MEYCYWHRANTGVLSSGYISRWARRVRYEMGQRYPGAEYVLLFASLVDDLVRLRRVKWVFGPKSDKMPGNDGPSDILEIIRDDWVRRSSIDGQEGVVSIVKEATLWGINTCAVATLAPRLK